MSDTQTLELPDEIYQGLLEAARESRQTPAGWITAHLRLRAYRASHSEKPAAASRAIDNDLIAAVLSPDELAALRIRHQSE